MPLKIDSSTLTVSSLTKEYVKVRVIGRRDGADIDPTAFLVDFAFTAVDVEPTTEWAAGNWENDNGLYYARALIGPGTSFVLADGTYDIWVRFADGTETPVRNVGRLIVT